MERPHHKPPHHKHIEGAEILIEAGPHWAHRFKLGGSVAQISDESGGWEEVERPGDVGMTVWRGAHPLRMAIPILLDGWRKRENQQDKLHRLHELVRDEQGDKRPPILRIYGPLPLRRHNWVVESIEYQDDPQPLRSRSGLLYRQAVSLNVMQFVPADDVKIKRRGKTGGGTYKVKRNGETCLSIAKKKYHEHVHDRARKIARLNSIRSIRKELRKGQRIKLPK